MSTEFARSISHELPGLIRKMWPSETHRFANHLKRLDKETRRLRFAHTVSDEFLQKYASRALELGGIVYAYFEDGEMRAVAELRPIEETWTADAEAAFSVEPEWQNTGIGTELMGRIIRSARNRNVQHLYMSCLAENRKMQKIASKHEANLTFDQGDIVGDIVPDGPTYSTRFEEALDDSRGYVMAVLELRSAQNRAA